MRQLLKAFNKNGLSLKNHIVMAPMTRSRAINNVPNEMMAEYYSQRKGAGLIITEGTAPAPEALGYPRIPGIFSTEQVKAWKKITSAVQADNSKIFIQLMHTGRIGHTDNLAEGLELIGPSDIKAAGQIFTDTKGMQDHTEPLALSTDGIKSVVQAFVNASINAVEAGFDGVELHGANGYLLEQFLNPNVNTRRDEFGGSMENRSRLILKIAANVAEAIGGEKLGVRLSPFSTLGDLPSYNEEETIETYAYLAESLDEIGIAYLHIGENASIPEKTFTRIREGFSGTIILCNGLTPETAEEALHAGFADLVGFGRSFLANPDFVKRVEKTAALNDVDFSTLYTPDEVGYTDYPILELS